MNWIDEIKYHKWIKYSQTGEEGYIDFILRNIEHTDYFVDIGAGFGLSNTRWFLEKGWEGLQFDDNKESPTIIKEWITSENVLGILEKNNCPKEFGLLSIDLDGNDFFILDKILSEYKPSLIVSEINGMFPIDESVSIKNNPQHRYSNDDYFGYSLGAGLKLAEKYGYEIIFQNDSQNAYYIRKDLLHDAKFNLEFTPVQWHTHNTTGEWINI